MEKFSFFNSVSGDRRYKAEDWANYFNKFITNGYFPNIASNLQVIASGTNMKVTLRAGAAWINGYMYQNTTDFDLTIQTADAVNSRKDRVILRLDHEKREIKAYVKKGTPSSSPVSPTLQRDADAYELAVAEVHVRNGVVVITQEAVTDVRLNKDLCGVVNSLLQADTTMIFNQYWDWFVRTKQKYEEDNSVIVSDFRKFMEDEKKRYNTEFTAWFQNLKNVLDTNTAGNLLNEINKINDKWNATLTELDKKSQALQHGLNVVNAPVASPLNIEIQGRTLVNSFGDGGDLGSNRKLNFVPANGTMLVEPEGFIGNESLSVTPSGVTDYGLGVDFSIDTNNYYLFSARAKVPVGKKVKINIYKTNSWINTIVSSPAIDTDNTWQYLYCKISKDQLSGQDKPRFSVIVFDALKNGKVLVDAFCLCEISQEIYNKIDLDPDYSGQKLMDKFPYVEGVRHLNPMVVAESGNLIPPFTEWETVSSVAKIMNPYELSMAAMGQQHNNTHTITVLPNTTYSFSYKSSSHVRYDLQLRDSNSAVEKTFACYDGLPLTFTTSGTTKSIRVNAYNYPISDIGTWSFSYPSLVLGDKPKPFAPRNPSYLYTNTSLAGQNGVNDVLYQEDGQWKVLRKWERGVILDGGKEVAFQVNLSGIKKFKFPTTANGISKNGNLTNTYVIQDYTNALMFKTVDVNDPNPQAVYMDTNNVLISVANSLSGFAESYTPTADEIKAYFNGWKVKSADGTGKPTAWVSVVDGKDAPTQTLAYVKLNRAPDYTPYKLTYQLATPRVETVQVEGELAASGVTQVSVDSGVVVREKAKVVNGGGYYRINDNALGSQLSNRVSKFIALYKNGQPVPIGSSNVGWYLDTTNPYGLYKLTCRQEFFDPTTEYTVTYLVQDKHLFTTNIIDAKVMYNQSLASTVREVVEKQADNSTLLFAQQAKVSELTAKTREYGLRLTPRRSGKDENDIFTVTEYKMANGTVRKRSVLSNPNAYGSYLTRTETEYLENGAVQKVTLLDLIYDVDGNFIDEVERT